MILKQESTTLLPPDESLRNGLNDRASAARIGGISNSLPHDCGVSGGATYRANPDGWDDSFQYDSVVVYIAKSFTDEEMSKKFEAIGGLLAPSLRERLYDDVMEKRLAMKNRTADNVKIETLNLYGNYYDIKNNKEVKV